MLTAEHKSMTIEISRETQTDLFPLPFCSHVNHIMFQWMWITREFISTITNEHKSERILSVF